MWDQVAKYWYIRGLAPGKCPRDKGISGCKRVVNREKSTDRVTGDSYQAYQLNSTEGVDHGSSSEVLVLRGRRRYNIDVHGPSLVDLGPSSVDVGPSG